MNPHIDYYFHDSSSKSSSDSFYETSYESFFESTFETSYESSYESLYESSNEASYESYESYESSMNHFMNHSFNHSLNQFLTLFWVILLYHHMRSLVVYPAANIRPELSVEESNVFRILIVEFLFFILRSLLQVCGHYGSSFLQKTNTRTGSVTFNSRPWKLDWPTLWVSVRKIVHSTSGSWRPSSLSFSPFFWDWVINWNQSRDSTC